MNRESFPIDQWTGRIDEEDGELGIRIHQKIDAYNEETLDNSAIVLLGFCSDEGVKRNKGRLGAKEAPNAIRLALANLPIHFNKNKNLLDAGNICCKDGNLEAARDEQIDKIDEILKKKAFPIVIGGGHETALGNFLAVAKNHQSIGIINLDAHFDLRTPNPISSSGTPFFEMAQYAKSQGLSFNYFVVGLQELGNTEALFKRADELNVHYILADQVHENIKGVSKKIMEFINTVDVIYLTLDMDVFDVAYAPGVSATTINGLTPYQVKTIIKTIIESGTICLADVVEYNPVFDRDNQTAKLAAQMVYSLIKA